MFLFIFESIGTSELILIGIIALIFLGPRRMPEMARKLGKMMADFRNTTNEFKSTWEREVNFEEEEKALRTDDLPEPVARTTPDLGLSEPDVPEVRAMDAETARSMLPQAADREVSEPAEKVEENADKRDWL